jgi:uncharacterized protein YjaZ
MASVFLFVTFFASPSLGDDNLQKFHIIRGYEGVKAYAAAARETDPGNYAALYNDLVTVPYMKECSGDGAQFSMSQSFLETPIQKTAELAAIVHAIEEHDVESRILDWLTIARRELSIPELTVCIFPYSPDAKSVERIKRDLNGNMGFSETDGLLWAQFIPADGWLESLPHMVVHEYHHAVTNGYFPQTTEDPTLLDLLISEGGAEAFALTLNPPAANEPVATISKELRAEIWPQMREHLESKDPDFHQLILVGDGQRMPRSAVYAIGTEIVLSFLKNNPHLTAAEWSALSARDLLDRSGYNPGHQ